MYRIIINKNGKYDIYIKKASERMNQDEICYGSLETKRSRGKNTSNPHGN